MTQQQRSQAGVIVPTPVADMTYRLRRTRAFTRALNLNVGAGGFVEAVVVPAGERWRIIVVNKPTTTVASSSEARVAGSIVELTATSTGQLLVYPATELWLHPGDALGGQATGDLGDASRSFGFCFEIVPENDHR